MHHNSAGFDLSIVIVNWNSAAFLQKCLESIYTNTKGVRFEVVVVDNASRDGCEQMLTTHFPFVRFIQSGSNLGFARANNLAFHVSSGRYVLFLNPDTEVIGSAFERLVGFLNENSQAGIAGPRLLNSDGSIQSSCIRSFPTIVNEAFDSNFLRRKFPRSRWWGISPLFENRQIPSAVDAISGASLMIRRSVFEAVGLFTTSYFMYAEDVDLCFKVRTAGWENFFVPDAAVVHHGGQSTRAQDDGNFSDVVLRESRWRFFQTRKNEVYSFCYRASTMIAAIVRLALLGGAWIASSTEHRNSIRLSCRKWARVLRWSIGLERWVPRNAEEQC